MLCTRLVESIAALHLWTALDAICQQSEAADASKFFGKLKSRFERYFTPLSLAKSGTQMNNTAVSCRAHMDLASAEVRFKDLSVSAEVALGARGEPTVLNAYQNQFEVLHLASVMSWSAFMTASTYSLLSKDPVQMRM